MSGSLRRMVSGAVGPSGVTAALGGQDRLLPIGRLEAFSDAVFAISITLLVLELRVPTGRALGSGLEHEWPRYLAYFVSFTFTGGVWIAHSNLTRFIRVADTQLLRLNLLLLLFVSILPFTTGIAATHLFVSFLTGRQLRLATSPEHLAVIIFGLNLTLASLMIYLMLRHASRRPALAADDMAEEELQAFARERRAAVVLQAIATAVGFLVPRVAVFFYLALAMFFAIDPLRRARLRTPRQGPSGPTPPTGDATHPPSRGLPAAVDAPQWLLSRQPLGGPAGTGLTQTFLIRAARRTGRRELFCAPSGGNACSIMCSREDKRFGDRWR
jgi:uncharacterized membrane protein